MRWVWFAGLTMVSLLIFDAGLHQLQRSTAHFSMHPAREDIHRDTLVVYFPGILTDGESSSVDVLPVWLQTGDVMLVSYEGDAFDGEAIIRQTVDKIARTAPQYKHIIFIGASMGGLLAYSTMVESRTLLSAIKYRLILIDAPTGWKDLQPGLQVPAPLAWLWWAGPFGNLASKLYYGATYVKPKPENIEPGVDQHALDEYIEGNMSHPVSWGMDENRFLMRHPQITRGSLDGVRVDFVRSTRDTDTVRKTFVQSWLRKMSVDDYHMHDVDSTHVGLRERPKVWQELFRKLLATK